VDPGASALREERRKGVKQQQICHPVGGEVSAGKQVGSEKQDKLFRGTAKRAALATQARRWRSHVDTVAGIWFCKDKVEMGKFRFNRFNRDILWNAFPAEIGILAPQFREFAEPSPS
jgi:hypothetical protein